MKSIFVRILSPFVLFLSFISTTYAAAETYTLDPTHSHVLWHISHFDFSHPTGIWLVEGTVTLDEASPKNSKVSVTIPIKNGVTGIPKLDEHMFNSDFFEVEKFPNATFVSDKVTPTSKNKAKVHGILTIHGVSKPVTLDVTLNRLGESPYTHKKTAGFTATTTIKRSDFGIDKYLPGLGDTVKIDIEAEAALGTESDNAH